jgi:5-methylcytosine-specific restriction endonuclease McrA
MFSGPGVVRRANAPNLIYFFTMASGSPEKRFWMKVDRREPDECWLWTAKSVTREGFGLFRVSPDKLMRADHFSYELQVEPIGDGLTLRHLCEQRVCVNPAHLSLMTLAEQYRLASVAGRAASVAKRREAEFCNSGQHRFTPENTHIDSRGNRLCKACRNSASRGRWAPRLTCKYGHSFPGTRTTPGAYRACAVCRSQKTVRTCSVEGCGGRHRANGYCNKHLMRIRERGTTDSPVPPPSEAERFWPKVDKNGPVPERYPDLGGCWIWTGRGWTGSFQTKSGPLTPRAWAWIDANGPVPGGMMILSTCGTKRCVHPEHSFAGTAGDRGALTAAKRVRCVRGHALAVYGIKRPGMRGRFCSECHRIRAREWRLQNPEANAIRHRAWYLRSIGGSEPSYPAILLGDPCSYCGAPCEHIDHIVPLSRGGSGEWDNLTASCAACNMSKGAQSLLTFMLGRAAGETGAA